MNVFGGSLVGDTNKIIVNLEIANKKMKNELSSFTQTTNDSIRVLEESNKTIINEQGTVNREVVALMTRIKVLEEIIKTLSNIYTKVEDTSELKIKFDIIQNSVNYTEKYLAEITALLRTRDADYFKISTEAIAKEEGRV